MPKKSPKQLLATILEEKLPIEHRATILAKLCMEGSEANFEVIGTILKAAAANSGPIIYEQKIEELEDKLARLEQGPLRMAKKIGVPRVYIHGMLGRRGEKPESGAIYVGNIESECLKEGFGRFVSLIGRFWSLDREENWDRIEKSYRWLVHGEGRLIPW